MVAERPVIRGVPKPLSPDDPPEWWQDAADRLGIPVETLREEVRIADEVLNEVIAEENAARIKP